MPQAVLLYQELYQSILIDFSNDEINEIAYEGEMGYHGNLQVLITLHLLLEGLFGLKEEKKILWIK